MSPRHCGTSLYQWVLPEALPPAVAERFPRACRPLLQVLYNRQIVAEDAGAGCRLREFMDMAAPDPDPFLLRDMDRAVPRILDEIRSGRPLGVFGHYDCDGVTAAALLTEALRALGATVVPHIPSRSDDYGIPANGLARLADAGVRLVVTVDCGIKALQEVEQAAAQGIDIIITDHHQCERQQREDGSWEDRLPPAYAVINPKRADCLYGFKSLAGVGVAFRLAQALAHAAPERGLDAGVLESLLDLVCLGTVADVVDLVGDNRRLVARGLDVIRSLRRPGIKSLIGAANLAPAALTCREVSFMLAPRINAAARMEHGKISLRLLQASNCGEAAPFALKLEELNTQRRQITEQAVQAACESLGERAERDRILVAVGNWITGVSGLVASQVRERFGKPALAIADSGGEEDGCVGSARSIPGFDVTAALGAVRHRLERYGGHSGAAGFTVRRAEIPFLEEELNEFGARHLTEEMLGLRLAIDGLLTVEDLNAGFRSQLDRLEPCGQGNPAPLFLVQGVLALPGSLRCYENGKFFFKVPGPQGPVRVAGYVECLAEAVQQGKPLDLVCHVKPDQQAASKLRLAVEDARVSNPHPTYGPETHGPRAFSTTAISTRTSGAGASDA